MGKGDKFQSESGFLDKADALEEAFEDTVHVPSYQGSDSKSESNVSSSTELRDDKAHDSAPQETQINVADLTWEFEDEAYSGDAPLAQARDAEQPSKVSPKRSDFFDRGGNLAEQSKFTPREFPPLAETHRFDPNSSGMRVSDFAQHAERLKWQNIKGETQTTGEKRGVSSRSGQLVKPQEQRPNRRAKREYPMMMSLLQDSPVADGEQMSDVPSSPPVPGTFFPTSSKKELVPESGPPDMEGLLSAMAEGVLLGGSSDGSSHMMITLNDEYFRGTELRISMEATGVKAHLIPPDYEVYRHLSSELPRLEQRLLARGLTVNEVSVLKP